MLCDAGSRPVPPVQKKKRKSPLYYAAIPMHGPILRMNQDDWHTEMSILDRQVYCLFKIKHFLMIDIP